MPLICANCGLIESNVIKLQTCSMCKSIHYCSKTCQRSHWEADHRKECKELCTQKEAAGTVHLGTKSFGRVVVVGGWSSGERERETKSEMRERAAVRGFVRARPRHGPISAQVKVALESDASRASSAAACCGPTAPSVAPSLAASRLTHLSKKASDTCDHHKTSPSAPIAIDRGLTTSLWRDGMWTITQTNDNEERGNRRARLACTSTS